jgi:hypothetical protein
VRARLELSGDRAEQAGLRVTRPIPATSSCGR